MPFVDQTDTRNRYSSLVANFQLRISTVCSSGRLLSSRKSREMSRLNPSRDSLGRPVSNRRPSEA